MKRVLQDVTNFTNVEYINPSEYSLINIVCDEISWNYWYWEKLESEENELNFIYNKWDKLPFRESRMMYITRKCGNMYNTRFDWGYRTRSANNIYKQVNWTLKNGRGKPFNDVFSKFCKQVYKEQQKAFLREFDYHNWSKPDWWIDENGLIQGNPWWLNRTVNKKVFIESKDFKTIKEYVHKFIGNKISQKEFDNLPYKYGRNYGYTLQDQYEEVTRVHRGYQIITSSNDYRYKRFKAEYDQKKKAERKFERKQKAARVYDFMSEKEKFNKANKLDKQKLQSHGFDENSFKRHHGRKYRLTHKLEEHDFKEIQNRI